MTTTLSASTETELDAGIADVNASVAGAFVIDLTADLAETYVLVNAVDLPSGVTLSINDGAYTLVGPYALAPAVTIASGSTLTSVGIVPTGEVITFAGTGVTNTVLAIEAASQFAATIEGLASGDVLAVSPTTITAATTGAGSYNSTTNTTSLTLNDAATTVAILSLEGDYSAASFNVSDDNVTVTLPSVPTTLSSGAILSGTQEVASAATSTQTGQIALGSVSDPATIINQGTYDITGAWGISAGNANSLLINDGTMERDPNGVNGVSYIAVDVIDTGTLSVPDNNPDSGDTNLQFDGADNSFSGIFVGAGMIDYGNPSAPGTGTDYIGTLDMKNGACTTSWAIVNQNGVITLSNSTTIGIQAGSWNFASDAAAMVEANPGQVGYADFADQGGTIAKTGGTGTTVIAVPFQTFGGGGSIIIETGTLAFNGPSSNFSNTISGSGTFSLGIDSAIGSAVDAINSGTTIASSGWTITDAGTAATLNESLSYAGTFTDK